jgi:hypothetical protein
MHRIPSAIAANKSVQARGGVCVRTTPAATSSPRQGRVRHGSQQTPAGLRDGGVPADRCCLQLSHYTHNEGSGKAGWELISTHALLARPSRLSLTPGTGGWAMAAEGAAPRAPAWPRKAARFSSLGASPRRGAPASAAAGGPEASRAGAPALSRRRASPRSRAARPGRPARARGTRACRPSSTGAARR